MRIIGNKPLLKELLASQYWSADRLLEMQWVKLEKLLKHAYESCPFYRERLNKLGLHPRLDFKDFESLNKLPILTKTDIQTKLASIVSTDPQVEGIRSNSTGGSTGIPVSFYQDHNYRLWADAARERAWRYVGEVTPHAIEAVLWGADRDVGRGFSLKSAIKNLIKYHSLPLNTFDLDAGAIIKFFRVYNLLRPKILRGYASSLYFIADFIHENEIQVSKPHVIISSAEMLWPAMRDRISRVFGADIIDSYGCREVSQIATECHSHSGLHIVMENQYVELIDGQILVTNLNNFGMPFIRYQVGDIAKSLERAPCSCGKHSHRLVGLKGRSSDIIELPGGRVVHGEFFTHLFYGIDSVKQFQVVYSKSQEKLLLRITANSGSHNIGETVRQRIEEAFGFRDVIIKFTERFDKTPTGKFRFVCSVDDFNAEGQSHTFSSASRVQDH